MATPKKIELTDEIRKAVLAEMCTNQGHQFALANAVVAASESNRVPNIQIKDWKLPHITCSRCGMVWVVVDVPAPTYEAAEEMIRAGAKSTTRIDELRKRRREQPPAQ